jgi:serine/threonine-protein phosphatase 2A regulatory subunit A
MHQNQNYLYRMTTLFAISALSEVIDGDVITDKMLPTVIKLSKDKVPNIRFNVAKCLGIISSKVNINEVQQTIKPCLSHLQNDKDQDVKFYASQALIMC